MPPISNTLQYSTPRPPSFGSDPSGLHLLSILEPCVHTPTKLVPSLLCSPVPLLGVTTRPPSCHPQLPGSLLYPSASSPERRSGRELVTKELEEPRGQQHPQLEGFREAVVLAQSRAGPSVEMQCRTEGGLGRPLASLVCLFPEACWCPPLAKPNCKLAGRVAWQM